MARQRRGTSASRPAAPQRTQSRPATTTAHPPAPVHAAPPAVPHAAPQQPGMFAQMASTAAGVAVGSAVGHTLGAGLTGMFGGGSSHAPAPAEAAPEVQQYAQPQQQQQFGAACEPDQKAFLRCLDTNSNDITACQFYLDMLKQCQAANRSTFN
ncbi:hypothetical protein HK097_010442 [Rhizophlyctis rosea]|uniref:CHCH domain-containing protein n=1 Tax=Rhizophlyctis rosea TaxID=64517 RepID=A0AAD5WZS3_9FUNG|nr:hypothetical protein HK097_010442 [Rhizophlyctis rosea]